MTIRTPCLNRLLQAFTSPYHAERSFTKMTGSATKREKLAMEIGLDVLSANHKEENAAKAAQISRSFVSDTITAPMNDMYLYAMKASLGDDVYHDASTTGLENHMAKLTGKEAAIFMPSGTMSNQIAIRTHLLQPPHSIACDIRSHINRSEAGGAAFFSGASNISIIPENGHHITVSDLEHEVVEGSDIHSAPTQLICLENTLYGTIIPQTDVEAISKWAHDRNIRMHLDGARIWHVAFANEVTLGELCAPFDSVSICFSKGLGAPVGSVLVGNKAFITKARWFRKQFGGGMRQTGFLAACAAYALMHNWPQLNRVHKLAKKLENGLSKLGVEITSAAETCMVFFDPAPINVTYTEIVDRAAALPDPITVNSSRLIVHIQTTEAAVDDLLQVVGQLKEEKAGQGQAHQSTTTISRKSGKFQDVYVAAASGKGHYSL